MNTKKIKSVQFNEINIKKNKSRASITNIIHLSREKQKKSVFVINSKKLQNNRNESLSVKRSKSNFRYSAIIKIIKKDKINNDINDENVENKNISKLKTYTEIRQHIYKKLKKDYISPYIEKFKVNQNYINNVEHNSFYIEPAKYYDYYQICYLTKDNIKNYRLLSKLHDHLICNDSQEYIMKYFNQEEIYIILKYLIYCIYENDKLLASNNYKKEKPDKNTIIELYNKLHESIFHSEDTFDIFDNNRKFLKVVLSDSFRSFRNRIYFTKLYTLFKSNINYVYIRDMPKEFIHNCIPNLFPHINKDVHNLKTYIKVKMNNNKESIELLLDKSHKDQTIQKFFKSSNNKKEHKNRNKSFDNDFIIGNLTISIKEEKPEINSILPRNSICNNKIEDENKDYNEVKYLLKKFNAIKIPKINEKENALNQNDLFYKKIQKMNSIKYKKEEYKQDLFKSTTNFSTIDNKSIMKIKNRNHFLNSDRKGSFKISFNKTNSFSKADRNTSDKSTIANANSNFNEQIYKINLDNIKKIHNTRNRQNKNKIKVLYENDDINKDDKNQYFKSRISSGKTLNKDIIKPYHEKLIQKTVSEKRISKKRNNNKKYNTKYRMPSSCQNLLNRFYLEKLEKNFRNKNKEINKNQIFMLCNFEKVYAETKKRGMLPKTKIKYNIFHKPFKGIYGHNYFLDLLNKKPKREIDEENKVKDTYSLEKINRSINKMLKDDILFFKNNYSLEAIVKGPNLYSNYK